ncbi:MAG TPA: hypothetical protein VFA61_11025 [Candidatus Udaeobacter sp.]|nr:hypothetical protein [Candidatus Udaeobacter sp.]
MTWIAKDMVVDRIWESWKRIFVRQTEGINCQSHYRDLPPPRGDAR